MPSLLRDNAPHWMKNRIKQWLPKPETLNNNRWISWMGPSISHPRLWHFSRKGIALGLALGIFFGLLIPVAQIPASATMAVLLRANLPMAVASTLVTNPVTFGPVYYGAYKLGQWVLGDSAAQLPATTGGAPPVLKAAHDVQEAAGWRERVQTLVTYLGTVGKPLMVGLIILASCCGLGVYCLTSWLWVLKIRWKRSRSLRQRRARVQP
ncbi:MAG: hypothetical protein RLZZ352_554 [Pseudomonadota bacterium]|jgi:uncharacterized protein (DUF2062 family)